MDFPTSAARGKTTDGNDLLAELSMKTNPAFPVLDDEQMEAVTGFGDRIQLAAGDILVPTGQKNYPFYVIQSGQVEIVESDGKDESRIAEHGPGEFTGDVDMLTGRSSLFTARAKTDVVAYSLCAPRVRRLLSTCPKLGDLLLDAFQTRRDLLGELPFVGVRVIGSTNSPATSALQEFFYKNHVPYTFFDAETKEGRLQRDRLDAAELELPIVRCNGVTVGNPSLIKVAKCLGIYPELENKHFDLAIVGSGPAGLSAAVYAASEGLRVLVIDRVGPGGQAGSSSKIENFVGFPSGLSGSDLAGRGYLQALKFGATFIAPETVVAIETDSDQRHHLQLESKQTVTASCVFVASGVSYRQLGLPGCVEFEGAGVYYAATSVEARACEGSQAIVVGGGNSAGQAAMFLAESAEQVHVLIRGGDLAKSMSSYLCERVMQHPKIKIHYHTEITEVCGNGSIDRVEIRDNSSGESSDLPCSGLFIFIGAKPHSDWLPDDILRDEKGFLLTGSSFFADDRLRSNWPLERIPCDLETTRPGILAGGDVRSGTTKRCGFAVGDGSLAVTCVHRYLHGLSQQSPNP